MAHAFSFPTGAVSEHRGLTFWMNRTLEELSEFRSEPDAHAVHDLRVALRRQSKRSIPTRNGKRCADARENCFDHLAISATHMS